MKKNISLIVGFLFMTTILSSSFATAQNSAKNNSITINPAQLVMGYLPVTYNLGISNKWSMGFSLYGRFFALGNPSLYGLGAGVSGKYHITSKPFHNGWFIKPQVNFGLANLKNAGNTFEMSPSVLTGYDWVFDSGLTISAGLGLALTHLFSGEKIDTKKIGFGVMGFVPTGEFTLGWAF